jgi:hypothetical protein
VREKLDFTINQKFGTICDATPNAIDWLKCREPIPIWQINST